MKRLVIGVLILVSISLLASSCGKGSGPTPTLAPPSGRIAFESFRDGTFNVLAMDVDGSNQTNLTLDCPTCEGGSGNDGDPAWSPGGTNIAFASERDGPWEI